MQEHQLIKKIKELKQIKPNKDWVLFTKREILEEGREEQIVSWLFTPLRRPALVVRPLIAGVLILAGVFVYLYLGALTPQIAQLPFLSERKGVETETMVASLEELQGSLEQITLGLNNLKKAKDPNQALVMTEIVKATAKEGERVINQIKSSGGTLSKKTLASLNDSLDGFGEVFEKAGGVGEEILGFYLDDLEQRSLSEEDELRLQKAIEYYNEGKYTEAMILIQGIGNN
ncbi:hypothetical protein KJA17_00340 [Patescibacteria group bacterium]|nr:hypothetical protein [Patescibacteria group bacterium]